MAVNLQVTVTELQSADEFDAATRREKLQVIELYSEWAGPTAACKSAWRKLALEHGGTLPCDLSTACFERCCGAAALAQHSNRAPTSEPHFLLFKGLAGKEVAHVEGVDLPTLLKVVAKHSSEGGAAVQRQDSSEA